jgi:hypothetical protein
MKYEILLEQLRDPIRLSFCTKADAVLIKTAADAIEELQKQITSADVAEARHGKWVIDEDGCLICSECGYADEINGISGEFMHSNYCASCGARMDSKK